jgi:hypothetical protein
MNWKADIRQWQFPREFRIRPPVWTKDASEQLKEIAELLAKPEGAGPNLALLADVGTGLWRLKGRMVDPDTGHPPEQMRRAYRHFESVWDALTNEGVKIYDHTGEPFEPGRAIDVMSFQPTPGLARDTIIETIKPTIYFREHLVQTGEVIVGTPEETAPR